MDKQDTTPREEYREPELKVWGTVADLTETGRTQNLGDVKQGSNFHSANQQ